MPKQRSGEMVPCLVCRTEFYRFPCYPNRRFCSKSCARTHLNLTPANPSYSRDISGEKNPMYGRGLVGEANPMYGKRRELCPRWKGGIKRRPDGYLRAVAPDDHPYPCEVNPSGLKYVLMHRLVMERHIGRYLEPQEVVHHIDGDPTNNDISNLELLPDQATHAREKHPPSQNPRMRQRKAKVPPAAPQ